MIKRLKNMQKDSLNITATGIGLGVASGLGGGAAVGKFSSKLPMVSSIKMTGHTVGIIKDSFKIKKKK